MIPFLALALLVGSAIAAVLLMLAVRRYSPGGSSTMRFLPQPCSECSASHLPSSSRSSCS